MGRKERAVREEGKRCCGRGQCLWHKWVEIKPFSLGLNKMNHFDISCSSSVAIGRIFSYNTWRVLDCSAVMSKKLSLD